MNSIWSTVSNLPSFESLNKDKNTDILIIGGGLAGILCAYMLEQAGADYILVEAETICSGITKNTTAKISAQHGLLYDKLIRQFGTNKAGLYLNANQAALKKFQTLSQEMDCDYEEKDSYVYSLNDRNKIERELAALEALHVPAHFKKDLPLPFPVAGAVHFPNQAQFNPIKFAASLVKGLNIYEHTRVLEMAEHTAVTEKGRITAAKIIAATHFPFINKHGSYFIKMYQHRSYVITLENGPDVDGIYVDENRKGMSFRNYDGRLLIGGGSHRTGKQGGNWRELEEFAQQHYPDANIQYRWAAQDCMTLDGVPYIGQYSKRTPDFYVATGFNKWGISSSMVSAMLLCDLVQGKENPLKTVFDPSRNMLHKQLAVNGFEAITNLLTPSKKRCPHLGCSLKWNPAEHSWDCPCHGSRFTENGKLIDNPATGNLKK